ncbi:acyl-CoA dehydrogenase family protein [Stackebrandtia soli]|uniref:acyl-CoA dehydrogenase family protein n=1 Tax=Stackebrandtia soli TaxID=1892856 RepID=UPI0039EC5C18
MTVQRVLPTDEAKAIVELTAEIADGELAPKVDEYEARSEFPREVLRVLGRSGLLGLPYPEELGGSGQPYEVYLQVLEELAARWVVVAEAVSVHTLSCFALATRGDEAQQRKWLPDMLGGELLGGYCLTEPAGGSDAAAMTTSAVADGDTYRVNGTKAFITHAGVADFYTLFARTGGPGPSGISSFHVNAATPGIVPQRLENKMGLNSSPTAQIVFDDVRVESDRRVGDEGIGFRIAMAALDAGRLGIAACAVGLAQAALDYAVGYAKEREQFGTRIIDFQGVGFMLADMATQISAARALTLHAARLKDSGRPFSVEAAQAKLFATDMCMKVTTDAVQVLGGYGYVSDHPVERYFREAKVLQIVEGTNQIQRLVIARTLGRS